MYRISFDQFHPNFDDSTFTSGTMDWKYFYGDINEELHPGMSEPLYNSSQTTFFVDANHAGNGVARCFHTSVLI